MAASHYQQLEVWTNSMNLAEAIYEAAKRKPRQEEYRLTAQMIRAAISIPANIAEGNSRATRRDYAHFISIARGSAAELETLLLLAGRTKLLPSTTTAPLLEAVAQIGRMLNRSHARLANPAS